MNLKVGMYVRTNYRKEKVIRKILNIVEDALVHDHYLIFDKPTKYTYYVEDNNYIAKENLIELIKIGDYVNGYKVVDFSVTYFNGTDRRKQYIAEIMKGIQILYSRNIEDNSMNYKIIFENVVRIEK